MAQQLPRWHQQVSQNFKEQPQKLRGVNKIAQYLQKHKIQQTFNVSQQPFTIDYLHSQKILTKLVHVRPADAQGYILEQLKAIQAKKFDKQQFLDDKDFQSLFETYDFLKHGQVTAPFLVQGLSVVGVENSQSIVKQKYGISMSDKVIKDKFLKILKQEHATKGFIFS